MPSSDSFFQWRTIELNKEQEEPNKDKKLATSNVLEDKIKSILSDFFAFYKSAVSIGFDSALVGSVG